nr:TetR/AcrR family transcriptional regulator [Propionibacterium sp.]
MVEVMSARRTQTRERLVAAAVEVFAEKGVAGASVEEICDRAGFTRGAFYSNFGSKDELCLAAVEQEVDRNLTATREAIASLPELAGRDLDALLDAAVALFLRAQRSDRVSILASAELRLYAVRSDDFRPQYRRLVDRVSEAFAALLEDAAAVAGYRPTVPGIDLVRVLHGVYEQSALSSLLEDHPADAPGRAHLLAGVLRTMLARP